MLLQRIRLKLRVFVSPDAEVEFKFNSGTYANEIYGTIYDFDGVTVIVIPRALVVMTLAYKLLTIQMEFPM